MSSFLKKMEEEQNKPKEQAIIEDEEEEDSDEEMGDEESKDDIAQLPAKHLGQNVQSAIPEKTNTSNMPLPPGLLPVGNSSGGYGGFSESIGGSGKAPAGTSSFSGSGLSQLKQQYEPLTWNEFFDSQERIDEGVPIYTAGDQGIVYVCLHGAGHSAMSFACLANILKKDSTVIAFDFRGHGQHYREDENELSTETLVEDTMKVISYVHSKYPEQTLGIIGHSMGGAIAIRVAAHIEAKEDADTMKRALAAVFVIDVVEGSAMDALPFMEQIVHNRPRQFPDLKSVIRFGIQSGQVRDKRSARVSMPEQVVETADKVTGLKKYVWRTDLLASKAYWEGWFKGLTQAFLDLKVKKMLLLAGADRMDKALTVAQMQGKFGMTVVDDCGHVIQEDQPQKVGEVVRHLVKQLKIKPKFEDRAFVINVEGKKVFIGR